MIFVNDTSGRTIYQDPVWKDLTGQDATKALGTGWLDRVHADDRALVEDTHYGAISAASAYQIEYRLLTPNDRSRWVQVGAQASIGPPGQTFIGFLGSLIILPDAAPGLYKASGHIRLDATFHQTEPSISAAEQMQELATPRSAPTLRQRIKSAIGLSRMARREVGGDGAYRTRVALDLTLIELAKEFEWLQRTGEQQ